MANKKPPNNTEPKAPKTKYDKYEDWTDGQKELAGSVFGLPIDNSQPIIPETTKVIEEEISEEKPTSKKSSVETVKDASLLDEAEDIVDIEIPSLEEENSTKNKSKIANKGPIRQRKKESAKNTDILPEDAGDVLDDVITPRSFVDEVNADRDIVNSNSDTIEDYDEVPELVKTKSRQFAEDVAADEAKRLEEENEKAIKEALDAQAELDSLYTDNTDDVLGNDDKIAKKKKEQAKKRERERRERERNRLPNNTGIVPPTQSLKGSENSVNFTNPKTSTNQDLSPSQSGSNNSPIPHSPSGVQPEGNSGVPKKNNSSNSSDAEETIGYETAKKSGEQNLQFQDYSSGTVETSSKKIAEPTIIPNTEGKVLYDDNYIEPKQTVNITKDVGYSDSFPSQSSNGDTKPLVSETKEERKSFSTPHNGTPEPVITPTPEVSRNFDASPNYTSPPPTTPLPHQSDIGTVQESGGYKEITNSEAKSYYAPNDFVTDLHNNKPPETQHYEQHADNAFGGKVNNETQPTSRTSPAMPISSPEQPSFIPKEVVDKPVEENSYISYKPQTEKSVQPPAVDNAPHSQGFVEAKNGNLGVVVPSTPPPSNNPPLVTPFVEAFKQEVSKYVSPDQELIVTETGASVTVNYGDYTAVIPKDPSVPSITNENSKSVAFTSLVTKVYEAYPEKPNVYEGNKISTTDTGVLSKPQVTRQSDGWNIDSLNQSIIENYGNTAILKPTDKPNVYSAFTGTENEAYITFHPNSHRVVDTAFKSTAPSKEAKSAVESIKSTSQTYANWCHTTQAAEEYLAKRVSPLRTSSDVPKGMRTNSPVVPIVPINKPIANGTQLQFDRTPKVNSDSLGFVSTTRATSLNVYRTPLSSGAVATALRNQYIMVIPETLLPHKGFSPQMDRLIKMAQEEKLQLATFNKDFTLEEAPANHFSHLSANGTVVERINDEKSRASKLADKTEVMNPNQFYNAINPAYNLSPLRNKPNYRSVLNSARGVGIYAFMQIRQLAMQNPVGEGMQQVSTYTILPFQMFYKPNHNNPLMMGLKHLPNYNTAVSTLVKEARALGISCVDNPSFFQITNITNRVYANARSLGFEPAKLNQTKIASELIKRQSWIKDASKRPANKSVQLINKEINSLKALSSAKTLHFSKTNISSFYIDFFKNNGINVPANITNLTNRRQFSMLRGTIEREIGGKYGIKDLTQGLTATRLESLMKSYKFTDKELSILRLLASPEMSRFSKLMQKADRRAMHFMLFLQRVFGQNNDSIQGAIKTVRWLRNVRMVIHYTHRVSQLSQRILMRVAHRHGWDKVINANRILTRNGRIIKNAPKKAGKAVGKAVKKGAKSASKNLAKTAVGKSAQKVTNKFAQSAVGKITKSSIEAIAKNSAKIASKINAIAAKKAAIEASISEALGGAFGIGSGAGATAVGAGAGAGAGGSAAGAGAGAGGAALEGTPVGWVITIVVVVILIVATLFVTVGPLITQSLEEDREARVYETIIEKLTEYDKGFIEGMKAIKINQLKDKGDTQVLVDNSITSNEATRFDISGYYDPSKEAPAQLEEWGWGDALDASSVPANKTASKLDPSSVNNLYDAHNRGAIFQFTDSPKYVFNLHSEKDGILSYDYVENEKIKNIPFTSNTREILAAVSTITEDQYTTLDNHYTGGIGTNYAQLLKGYAYGGIRVKADVAGETGTGVKEGFTSASLWSATHGYQTATSKLYTCNGCQKLENVSDFNDGYYCNSEEWKTLSSTSTFMYNKPTLSELSANEKTLPYNSLGCYQHKQTTSAKYMEKSGKEYYCGNYHKTSSGKYVQCISSNNTVLYGNVVGHSYTDIYGLKPVSGHIQTNCQYYDVVFAGEKTVTESGYIQDKQYYSHNCPDFNVKGCSNYIDVSSHFGTTAYLITQSDFGIGGDFDRPSCASYTDQIKVVHGNNSTTYRLVYCTGHHKCNTNTIEKNSEPTQKTVFGSFYIYYGGNHNDKGTFIINGVSSVEPTFELTVKDYCMHYKASSATFDYQLYKKVCKGHCDGHNETNNDHPCVYCIGHKDKEINAYIISSLDSSTQESKLYGGKEGHWDNLPFNTIYSADTCSGPIALAHDNYMDSNVFGNGVVDTIDQTWMLTMFRYNDWYKNERHAEKYDFLNKDKTAISTAQNMRQSAETKLLSGWNEIYNSDIFAKVSKTGDGEYFGYFSSTASTEWDYIENQIIRSDATEQQKYFVQWAINSCGKVPYSPNGKVKGIWYDSVTKTNINGFGTVTSPDSAGRILKGLNESQWLNWCYASAFSSAVKELPNGDRVYINSLAPPLDESTSVPLKEITDNLNKKYTLDSDNPEKGFTNLPTNAKNIQFVGTTALKEGVQAGDIIVLRKKCPLCSKMFNNDKSKCDDCNISLTQDFAIVIGWTDYAKSTCENSSCAKKGKAYKDDTVCPQCGERLTRSIKPKGDDLLVVEMSSDACEEVVCIKRYDERAFDLSNGGNKYVVCRFLN